MFGYALLAICGYYGIAGFRGLLTCFILDWKNSDPTSRHWVSEHPYHFFTKRIVENGDQIEDGVVGIGFLMSFVSGLACLFSVFGGDPAITLAFFAGGGCLYFLVATSYWMYRHDFFPRIFSWVKQKTTNWWASRVPNEIQEVQAIQKNILRVIKGKRMSKQIKGIMAKSDQLIKDELPRLLNLRQELNFLIDNAKHIIEKEKNNGIIEGEEKLMKESEHGLETLQKRLGDVSKKIRLIPTVLDHLCIQLSVIISSDSTSEVQNVIDDVQMDLDILLQSHEEIEQLDAKYQAAKEAARQEIRLSTNQAIEEIFPKVKDRAPAKVAEG